MFITFNNKDLMNIWLCHCSIYKWLHDRSYKLLRKKHLYITIPILLINTVSAMIIYNLELLSTKNEVYVRITVGSLNLVCTLLNSIRDITKYSENSKLHSKYFDQWATLKNEIYFFLSDIEGLDDSESKDTFINLKSKYNDLIQNSPFIPNVIINEFKRKHVNRKIKYLPDIISNNFSIYENNEENGNNENNEENENNENNSYRLEISND